MVFIHLNLLTPVNPFTKMSPEPVYESCDTDGEQFFPGDFEPVLTFEGKCSYLRANPAHLVGHLPPASQNEMFAFLRVESH